jgi:hypothetical protein
MRNLVTYLGIFRQCRKEHIELGGLPLTANEVVKLNEGVTAVHAESLVLLRDT